MNEKQVHLLIVDDDEPNRRLLRRMLNSQYKLSEARDVSEAIEILEEQSSSIKLILSDYLMPGKSGVELAEEVRRRWPSILTVLLTGFKGDEVLRVSENGTVCDVLVKPWRIAALRKILQDRLG
ncbi:MAG: response regulator [Kofleriaceae bacterium]|nr:response regulator [Kofleriaceae bacterium]